MNRIGDALDYRHLAQLHRPTDERALAVNARVLAAQGLTERDIAQALQVGIEDVRRWLGEREARW